MALPCGFGFTGIPATVIPAGSASGAPLTVPSEPIVTDTGSPTPTLPDVGDVSFMVRKWSGAVALLGHSGPSAKHCPANTRSAPDPTCSPQAPVFANSLFTQIAQ